MSDKKFCPCCGRHCDLDAPHCERGKEYARTGIVPEHKNDHHGHEHHEHDHHEHDHHMHKEFHDFVQYDSLDDDNKLIINLRDLGHMLRFMYEGKGSQKRILIILNESGQITQRELTERIGIKPGSASEVISKLEKSGLILRTPSPDDRRTTIVELTEEGKKQAQQAFEQRQQRHNDMFACLSQEEKETLLLLLEKINSEWKKLCHDDKEEHGHEEGHGPHGHHKGHGHHKPFGRFHH